MRESGACRGSVERPVPFCESGSFLPLASSGGVRGEERLNGEKKKSATDFDFDADLVPAVFAPASLRPTGFPPATSSTAQGLFIAREDSGERSLQPF